jgi:hypothetical protein
MSDDDLVDAWLADQEPPRCLAAPVGRMRRSPNWCAYRSRAGIITQSAAAMSGQRVIHGARSQAALAGAILQHERQGYRFKRAISLR